MGEIGVTNRAQVEPGNAIMEPLAEALRQSRERPVRFAVVFDDQFRPLISYLGPRVYDHEIAVDLASETMAAAFQQRHRFRGSTDREVVAWLNAGRPVSDGPDFAVVLDK